MAFFTEQLVPLTDIAAGDTTYQISSTIDKPLAPLVRSMAGVGLLSPPLLTAGDMPLLRVVTGFRRLQAARQLGMAGIPCRIMETATPLACFRIAIADNALQRSLNTAEQARAMAGLAGCLDDPAAVQQAAAEAGMTVPPDLVEKLLAITDLPAEVMDEIALGTLGLTMAAALAGLAPAEAGELTRLFRELRLGLNKQRAVLHRLQEIAARERTHITALLAEDGMRQILADRESDRAHRGKQLLHYLDRRRYPAITQAEEAFARRVKALQPGPKARLAPPPNFEGRRYTLTLLVDEKKDLETHLRLLQRLADDDLLEK